MKLVTLIAPDRTHHIGALLEGAKPSENQILDFYTLEPQSRYGNMIEFIELQSETLPWAKAMIEKAKAGLVPPHAIIPEADALLTSPIPRPISCRDGYAFRQHVESARKGRGLPMIPEFDEFPVMLEFQDSFLQPSHSGDDSQLQSSCIGINPARSSNLEDELRNLPLLTKSS